ncbi:hypothetical protein HY612_00335 [Candidatus Roizmanbacteria bacterium]|nr:hypothetical protein [Candidatus Roizmanbacteria bacterium]
MVETRVDKRIDILQQDLDNRAMFLKSIAPGVIHFANPTILIQIGTLRQKALSSYLVVESLLMASLRKAGAINQEEIEEVNNARAGKTRNEILQEITARQHANVEPPDLELIVRGGKVSFRQAKPTEKVISAVKIEPEPLRLAARPKEPVAAETPILEPAPSLLELIPRKEGERRGRVKVGDVEVKLRQTHINLLAAIVKLQMDNKAPTRKAIAEILSDSPKIVTPNIVTQEYTRIRNVFINAGFQPPLVPAARGTYRLIMDQTLQPLERQDIENPPQEAPPTRLIEEPVGAKLTVPFPTDVAPASAVASPSTASNARPPETNLTPSLREALPDKPVAKTREQEIKDKLALFRKKILEVEIQAQINFVIKTLLTDGFQVQSISGMSYSGNTLTRFFNSLKEMEIERSIARGYIKPVKSGGQNVFSLLDIVMLRCTKIIRGGLEPKQIKILREVAEYLLSEELNKRIVTQQSQS